jgi:hypothetical protein
MANIQRVEELHRSTRVTDAFLLSIHAVGPTSPTTSARGRPPATTAPDLIITLTIEQNLIGIVAVRPNINNNFLSREYNYPDFNYVKEKSMPGRSQLF